MYKELIEEYNSALQLIELSLPSAAHEHGFRYPRKYLEGYVQSMYLRAVLCRTNANARRQVTKQKKGNAELSKIALWMIAFGLNGNHCTWSAWDLPRNDLVKEGDVSFSPHISRLMDVSALLYPSCARPLTTIKEELQSKNNFIPLSQSWCSPKELLFFSHALVSF